MSDLVKNKNKKGRTLSGVQILEELKQLDYELYIRTQGFSHLTEEQWDWLIDNFKYYKKESEKNRN